MSKLIRILRGFAYVWFVLASLFIIASLFMIWRYEGPSRVQEIMNPLNVWNYVILLMALAPGLGSLFLANYIVKLKPLEK